MEEGIVREFGMDMYALLYSKGITNKDLLYSARNSAQRYVAAWMGGEFGREWICVLICLAESLRCSPETITTLLVGYALIQNKKLNIKRQRLLLQRKAMPKNAQTTTQLHSSHMLVT